MNRLEAMTRHVMIRNGVDPEDLPLMLHAALHGHGPSRRALERASGWHRTHGFIYANIRIGSFGSVSV